MHLPLDCFLMYSRAAVEKVVAIIIKAAKVKVMVSKLTTKTSRVGEMVFGECVF